VTHHVVGIKYCNSPKQKAVTQHVVGIKYCNSTKYEPWRNLVLVL